MIYKKTQHKHRHLTEFYVWLATGARTAILVAQQQILGARAEHVRCAANPARHDEHIDVGVRNDRKRPQRTVIRSRFTVNTTGMVTLL